VPSSLQFHHLAMFVTDGRQIQNVIRLTAKAPSFTLRGGLANCFLNQSGPGPEVDDLVHSADKAGARFVDQRSAVDRIVHQRLILMSHFHGRDMIGFAPGVITTSAGSARIPLLVATSSATASRSCNSP
jgi:hypothetical protein